MLRAPTVVDVEQLSHLAADADGAPLSDEALAFLAGPQDVLRIDHHGDLAVIGVASTTYYPAAQVRAAIAEALPVWALVRWAYAGELPPPDPAGDALVDDLALEELPE